ncbi:uncharacterized protein LOC129309052 [Prosopis cineraria]|uniref:uncharacterized protein LOC129309052 n=1 Tax=Prosopis cineraria TaxID=364024 RepID=UPI002410063E|nr:uncharacterized protein LOC129309052 [Prosopis cineraria]
MEFAGENSSGELTLPEQTQEPPLTFAGVQEYYYKGFYPIFKKAAHYASSSTDPAFTAYPDLLIKKQVERALAASYALQSPFQDVENNIGSSTAVEGSSETPNNNETDISQWKTNDDDQGMGTNDEDGVFRQRILAAVEVFVRKKEEEEKRRRLFHHFRRVLEWRHTQERHPQNELHSFWKTSQDVENNIGSSTVVEGSSETPNNDETDISQWETNDDDQGMGTNDEDGAFPRGVLAVVQGIMRKRRKKTNALPVSQHDLLEDTSQPHYFSCVIPDKVQPFHLIVFNFGGELMKAANYDFFANYKSMSTSENSTVSLADAFIKSTRDMVPMSFFLMLWASVIYFNKPFRGKKATWKLLLTLVYFFGEPLLRTAPHQVNVIIRGSFEIPVYWFTVLGAIGFSLLEALFIYCLRSI